MSYIITAIISAMIGGAVGLFVGRACAVAARADEEMNKNGGQEK